jgi:hypothetical protein
MVKTYTEKQFIEDVKKEARALREHGTEAEIERLNLSTFDGKQSTSCIYGQMTGDCFSDRAETLIKSCAPVFIAGNENGGPTNKILEADSKESLRWSPIEKYAFENSDNCANLIAYLKGERNDLVL